jgi:hypothetical protein
VQDILAQYDGSLIQLTTGDKGSYLYAAFGAPTAHEDDPERASEAALQLRELQNSLDFINSIQIGISQGRMRTGAYGAYARRTYGEVAITDYAGRVRLGKLPLPPGTYTVELFFSGSVPLSGITLNLSDERYQPASSSSEVTISYPNEIFFPFFWTTYITIP